MQTYSDIIESFPKELQLPMLKLMDRLREEKLDTFKRGDFEELKGVVSGLAERVSDLALAQKRTEQSVEELTQAQKRTEQRVAELAEAQKKTEESLRTVIKEQKNIRRDFGGLSDSIGYTLENQAIRYLPNILEKDFGLKVEVLDRRFIEYPDGGDDEINIYGEGLLNGEKVYVIGESKSRLGRKDVDRFSKFLIRVSNHLHARIIPILVTHSLRPQVERYAKEKIEGLRLYMSFQLV